MLRWTTEPSLKRVNLGEQDDRVLTAVLQDERMLEARASDFFSEKLVSWEELLGARAGLTTRLKTPTVSAA